MDEDDHGCRPPYHPCGLLLCVAGRTPMYETASWSFPVTTCISLWIARNMVLGKKVLNCCETDVTYGIGCFLTNQTWDICGWWNKVGRCPIKELANLDRVCKIHSWEIRMTGDVTFWGTFANFLIRRDSPNIIQIIKIGSTSCSINIRVGIFCENHNKVCDNIFTACVWTNPAYRVIIWTNCWGYVCGTVKLTIRSGSWTDWKHEFITNIICPIELLINVIEM